MMKHKQCTRFQTRFLIFSSLKTSFIGRCCISIAICGSLFNIENTKILIIFFYRIYKDEKSSLYSDQWELFGIVIHVLCVIMMTTKYSAFVFCIVIIFK